MGIFKKPKLLIICAAIVLVAIVLAVIFFPKPQKTIGVFGLDRESEETVKLQQLLVENGYAVRYVENLEELSNTDCNAWIVRVLDDWAAQQVFDAVGEKAIFVGRKPALTQPVSFVGRNMADAGELFGELLCRLPLQGDTNEDGIISCVLLTGSLHNWETIAWQEGLLEGITQAQLPVEIVAVRSCLLVEEEGRIAIEDSLSTFGRDIEVILASSEVLSEGAAQAITQSGWEINNDFYLLSVGHTVQSINALNEQRRSGLVYGQWSDLGQLLLDAVANTVDGEAPQDYLLPFRFQNNSTPLQ